MPAVLAGTAGVVAAVDAAHGGAGILLRVPVEEDGAGGEWRADVGRDGHREGSGGPGGGSGWR